MTMTETGRRWVAVKGVRRSYARPSATRNGRHWVAVGGRAADGHSESHTNGDAPRADPRVEIVDADAPIFVPIRVLHPQSRAIRITRATSSSGRRRWSVDFLVRHRQERQ